ncbi:sulfotransferase 1C4-like [Bacillus rossius redtenbacheri]|uniref:sulfotransferase 1C4-like n=1 Tax=Bacillus rossius redtenbacheri TaxID=93214 RepID=UPI002FDD96B4
MPEPPFEIRDLEPEDNRRLLADFAGERSGFVRAGSQGWLLPSQYRREWPAFYHFQPRADDTWVVTFPRSGTTWTQEMVWMIENNLDHKTARRIPLVDRFPFLEFNIFVHDDTKAEFLEKAGRDKQTRLLVEKACDPAYKVLNETSAPRFIKTHFPFSLLPPNLLDCGAKVIYVARNPKDVAVSFYHLNKLILTQGYTGDFVKYWDYFENNLQPWTPYWTHIQEGWERRHLPNMLFLFYEDMIKDLPAAIQRVAGFLGRHLTGQQVQELAQHLHIDNFRRNPAVNMEVLRRAGMLSNWDQAFVRRGKDGGWVDEFTPELNKRADLWIKKHLETTDLRFPSKFIKY